MQSDDLILAQTTCGSQNEAQSLASALVGEHLAACATIGQPLYSIYPWQGRIETETEIPLTLKTTRAKFAALHKRITSLHSYEVPELLATPVVEAGPDYARWLRNWVEPEGESN